MSPQMNPTTVSGFKVADVSGENSNPPNGWSRKSALRVTRVIRSKKMKNFKRLLKNRIYLNVSLRTVGPTAGYTLLHLACKYENEDLVKLLIESYHADVNVVADDGAQPLLLAYLLHNYQLLEILLKAGADVNAEISKDLHLKYNISNKNWCDDFGDKMKILTHAVLYNGFAACVLLEKNANYEVRSPENPSKTILMRAIENGAWIDEHVIQNFKDRGLINVRDDDGYPATHYLLHPKLYGESRYDIEQLVGYEDSKKGFILSHLVVAGADIYATVNRDPDTLLLNMAAYRGSYSVLLELLPHYDSITKSRALYYATLPIEDHRKLLRRHLKIDEPHQLQVYQRCRKRCTELILKDLMTKLAFGLPVPEEEKKVMDKLIATDTNIRRMVYTYEKNVINETLKNNIFHCGDQSIIHYDIMLQILKNKNLRFFVNNYEALDDSFSEALRNYYRSYNNCDYDYFFDLLKIRLKRAKKRFELLHELKKIRELRNAIPLPYELVLMIIKFLNNYELENFINSFLNAPLFIHYLN